MKNRLTFANVINILLENKKKTYPQHKLICDLFAEYLGTSDYSDTIYAEDNTMYSRWCTGARPIPMEILHTYEDDDNWGYIETSFDDEIIPNLINESQARSQMEELIKDSIPVIGTSKADELIAITDNALFFTQVIHYAILSDHEHSKAFSPDLSEDLQNCFLPPVSQEFVGRKDELKQAGKLLQDNHVLFISGIAGIGKREKALSIRSQHNELGLMESHDLLQQLINLTNMLILAKDYDMASQILTLYENTVLEHEGSQTFDYGICQFMNGVLALSEGIPAKAETYLLTAESIITDVMGTDNEYAKSVYKYLYSLYARWHKPELADTYKIKCLS